MCIAMLKEMLLLTLAHNYICTSSPTCTNTKDALHNSDNCNTKNSLYLFNQQDVGWWNIYSSENTKHWKHKAPANHPTEMTTNHPNCLERACQCHSELFQANASASPFGLLHQSCVWDGKCVIQLEGEDIWITFIIYEHV